MDKIRLLVATIAFGVLALVRGEDLGDVAYSEGGGTLGFDPTFFWDDTNHFLGIGTNTPAWPIDSVTIGAGYFFTTSYRESANGGGLQIQHARGTPDAPALLQNGDGIGAIYFNPINGDGTFDQTACEIRGVLRSQSVGYSAGQLNFIVQSTYPNAMSIIGAMSTGNYISDIVSIGDSAPTRSYKFQVLDNQ